MWLFVDKIRTILRLQSKQKRCGQTQKIALWTYPKLIGIEDITYIELESLKRVYAIYDQDLERKTEQHLQQYRFN